MSSAKNLNIEINVLGRYSFTLAESVVKGELRPLNNPDEENLLVALG